MTTSPWTTDRIISETVNESRAAGTDPAIVLAVFEQESHLNPLAVGDGGTSFGLRQLHVGGALGSHTPQWAFNPANAIPDAVQAFHGVTSAAGATAVQRPANPGGYSSSLAPLIAKWRAKLAGSSSSSSATSSSQGKPYKSAPERGEVAALASSMGLAHTDGDRSPNAGYGAPNSDHSTSKPTRWADDYSGTPQAMAAFVAAVRKRWPQLTVLPPGHEYSTGPNVHVAGDSKPGGATSSAGSSATAQTTDAGLLALPDLGGFGDKLAAIGVTLALLAAGLVLIVLGVNKLTGGGVGDAAKLAEVL